MYAAIRQGKAKTGMSEELARRIKEGAIPIVSDVEGFMAYYVVYAPDDTVTAISIFNNYAAAEESNRRVARVDRAESDAPARRASHSDGWASDRAYLGIAHTKMDEVREETRRGLTLWQSHQLRQFRLNLARFLRQRPFMGGGL